MTKAATDKPADKPLKIVRLISENIKRITAVNITPKGNLVQITGRNRSGKTSALQSIWWAIAGAANIQAVPIRNGEDNATITVDLGDYIVTRRFERREGGEITTSIKVESPDGGKYTKAQTLLDSFVGSLSLDPLAFARAKPKEQFEALKRFVADVDFDQIARLNQADFEKRTTINREAKQKEAQAAAIGIPEVTPSARADETAIVDEIGAVGDHNAMIERRREGREAVAKEATELEQSAAADKAKCDELLAEIQRLRDAGTAKEVKAADLREKLANAEPLPAPKDAAEVRARLEQAKRVNAAFEQHLRRNALLAEVEDLNKQSAALKTKIDHRDAAKREAIAKAKMPVEGLGFGDEAITLNGLPFDQASDAEQLRASVAIAMAANPRLKVILVRDGSLLDEDGMKLLGELADKHDCQVWAESVDSSGKVGIVMEDGHVASTPESRAADTAQAAE